LGLPRREKPSRYPAWFTCVAGAVASALGHFGAKDVAPLAAA